MNIFLTNKPLHILDKTIKPLICYKKKSKILYLEWLLINILFKIIPVNALLKYAYLCTLKKN